MNIRKGLVKTISSVMSIVIVLGLAPVGTMQVNAEDLIVLDEEQIDLQSEFQDNQENEEIDIQIDSEESDSISDEDELVITDVSSEGEEDAASDSSSEEDITISDEEDVVISDDVDVSITDDKAAIVEVIFTKTFTYDGTAQQLTKNDFIVKYQRDDGTIDDVDPSAYELDFVASKTDAGEYDATIIFTVEPYKTIIGESYSFKWIIAPKELTSVKISCDYSTTYGPTAKALTAALLKKAKEDKKITITAGTTTLAVDDVPGFAFAIEDSNGVIADGDTVPNVGIYKLTVDLSSLSTNYKVSDANITKREIHA